MKRVLQIEDTSHHVFLHVAEVLAQLEPEARALHWSVLDLGEAFAPEGSDLDVLAIERRVEESPTGLHLSYDELARLAARLQQVVDGLFVGCADAGDVPARHDADAVIIERAVMVVAAIDSTFWLVSAPDAVLARIHARFERVTEQDASAVALSTGAR